MISWISKPGCAVVDPDVGFHFPAYNLRESIANLKSWNRSYPVLTGHITLIIRAGGIFQVFKVQNFFFP